MIERIFGEIPNWMRPNNPLLRYELRRHEDKSQSRFGRIASWVLLLSALVIGGVLYTTTGLQRNLEAPYSIDVWRVIIFPLLLIQLVMRVAGVSLGVGAITDERQRQTWDNMRATEKGAELSLRTRWVSVFYRLRGLIFTTLVARLILIGMMLYDIRSMQGGFLDLIAARATPSLPAEAGILILGAFMTAFVMMPLTALGVDIALGLYISANYRNRSISSVLQILVIAFRVVTTALLFWWLWRYINDVMPLADSQALGLLTAFSILGDWGVVFSQLSLAGDLWATVPYTIFIGLMMLGMVLIQVGIASGLLKSAAKATEIRE